MKVRVGYRKFICFNGRAFCVVHVLVAVGRVPVDAVRVLDARAGSRSRNSDRVGELRHREVSNDQPGHCESSAVFLRIAYVQ